MDAFNDDSIPVHLLTREALGLYLLHLRGADSVIVVNATNAFVNLTPVVAALAQNYGLKATSIAPQHGSVYSNPVFSSCLPEAIPWKRPKYGKPGIQFGWIG